MFLLHFNTSHVNVNQTESVRHMSVLLISIHLMLMLIVEEDHIISSSTYFNTSHVNVNHVRLRYNLFQKLNFNTSHVNVNPTCDYLP